MDNAANIIAEITNNNRTALSDHIPLGTTFEMIQRDCDCDEDTALDIVDALEESHYHAEIIRLVRSGESTKNHRWIKQGRMMMIICNSITDSDHGKVHGFDVAELILAADVKHVAEHGLDDETTMSKCRGLKIKIDNDFGKDAVDSSLGLANIAIINYGATASFEDLKACFNMISKFPSFC